MKDTIVIYILLAVLTVIFVLISTSAVVAAVWYALTSSTSALDCVNGIYCEFCETKCICKYGWEGTLCDELIDSEIEFYDATYLYDSMNTFYAGNYNDAECAALCTNDTYCKAYYVNPCPSSEYLPACGSPPCCDPTHYPDGTCCLPRCTLVYNMSNFARPEIISYYEKRDTVDAFPEDFTHMPANQDIVHIKNGKDWYGLLSTYNDEYGLVFVDPLMYLFEFEYFFYAMFGSFDPNATIVKEWFANLKPSMEDYASLPRNLGNVLEISDHPFLQLKRVLQGSDFVINSMTAASFYADIYAELNYSDYRFTYLGKELVLDTRDYSKQLYDQPKTQYDTIILTTALYQRSNLPILLTNVLRSLKTGGKLIMREQKWSYINETVLYNYCMAAGMPKDKFIADFLLKFNQLLYNVDDAQIEPTEELIPTPIELRTLDCWDHDNSTYYHPNHNGRWFSYIGTKK